MILVQLKRFPLKTPYLEQVEQVRQHVRNNRALENAALVIDHTGPGIPAVELFQAAGLPLQICPVTITGGQQAGAYLDHRGEQHPPTPARSVSTAPGLLHRV